MHLVSDQAGVPVSDVGELRALFERAGKPPAQWRVGTEHEMCGVHRSDGRAPTYEDGISKILDALCDNGWEPVMERGKIIALLRDDAQVTIEPGGQLEHAARPVFSTAELLGDLARYIAEVCVPSRSLDIAWLAIGFRPFGTRADVPWMPKHRYELMRDYLPAHGHLALDMMKRTATVQVNLDYQDAADARAKMRCLMSVTPLLTALYSNSPIVDGVDSGFQSYRAEVWRFTDPDRCGLLPFVFEEGDFFSQYTEWALDVPMFFVHRAEYLPANGMTFREFLDKGFLSHRATLDDWELHLSTLFPEARMKKFIEVRGCDASTLPMTRALGSFCRGLLYSRSALDAATQLTAGLNFQQRLELAGDVPRKGLSARVPGSTVTVGDLARELVGIVKAGLREIDPNELELIEPICEIAESGRTLADGLRELWARNSGSLDALISAMALPELSSC